MEGEAGEQHHPVSAHAPHLLSPLSELVAEKRRLQPAIDAGCVEYTQHPHTECEEATHRR